MSVAHSNVGGLLRKHGYIELKKVGEGSFGKALLVRSEDGQRLICKMVDVSKASRREMEDAVKEGKLLSDLKHPYIVRYRESFTESGWLCILMDYCEGGDLTARITEAKRSRKPLAEDQILRWFAQAILALKYIHEKHVLHRDLKPSNFFLSKSGNLKMGDFGIAKVLACTIAVAKTQIGTPYYLSPELCQEKPYTFSSDIWAMGCILYELCALRVPFDAPNIPGLVQKITKAPVPTVPATYSSFLRELVGQMLNRNADRRPSPEEILQKPQLQGIVKQMLDEAQEAVQAVDDGVQQAHSEQAAISASPSAPSALPSSVGGDRAGGFRGAVPSQMGRSPSWGGVGPSGPGSRPGSRGGSPLPLQRRSPALAAGAIAGLGSQPGSRAASPSNRVSGAAQLEAYRKHDLVEYWSVSHGDWLPATVMNVDMEGRIVIDLKPNTWLTKEDQATKVRRRARAGTPGGLPSQIRRTPSADHLGVRAPSPRCVPSPGRAMSPHRAASPFRPSIDAPFRAPSPRRRDAPTPRRSAPGIPPAGGPSLGDSPLRAGGANVACGYIP